MATTVSRGDGEKDAVRLRRGVTWPAITLGIGLGGLFDGIVLHQILQWHHMLTSTGAHPATTVRGLEVNTFWDGLFHLTTYGLVIVAISMLWSRAQASGSAWPWRRLAGWSLVGWGAFNLVEGIVDHHLLGIHHVRSGPGQLAWDVAFLVIGAVLVVVGWFIARGDLVLSRPQGGRWAGSSSTEGRSRTCEQR